MKNKTNRGTWEHLTILAKKNGYSGVTEYRNALSKQKGYKNSTERTKAWMSSKGFNTWSEYEDYLAQKKGFKNRWERKKNKMSISNKKYTQTHKEKVKAMKKRWSQSPNGKISLRKHKNEHHRKFGFNPLNDYFEECEAHHIDMINVVFVSKRINQIYHRQNDETSMTYVNILAWTEMESGVL